MVKKLDHQVASAGIFQPMRPAKSWPEPMRLGASAWTVSLPPVRISERGYSASKNWVAHRCPAADVAWPAPERPNIKPFSQRNFR
jgi:hypothetical protein